MGSCWGFRSLFATTLLPQQRIFLLSKHFRPRNFQIFTTRNPQNLTFSLRGSSFLRFRRFPFKYPLRGPLGHFLRPSWGLMGASWGHLGACWRFWEVLGPSWSLLGWAFERFGEPYARFSNQKRAKLRHSIFDGIFEPILI